jgi:CDP-diglyceride synthetase
VSATFHDPALVLLSLLAVGSLVFGARAIGATGRVSPPSLRKALHAAVGAWTLLVTPYFNHLAWAIVPPVLFGAVNASGRAKSIMPTMAATPADARGLWTFPLGVLVTYLLFWEDSGRRAILAGLAALAFADPIAAIVGSRFGQRRFQGFGHGRTLEGSAAFFLVAGIAIGIVASGGGGDAFPWRMGIGCGLAGAAAEALTPSGWDNVSIPLAVAAAYNLLV